MSGLSWLLKWPYTVFDFGMWVLFLAVVYTYIGKMRIGSRWVYRANEPKRYWLEVGGFYLVGVGMIGYFWYLANRHQH